MSVATRVESAIADLRPAAGKRAFQRGVLPISPPPYEPKCAYEIVDEIIRATSDLA